MSSYDVAIIGYGFSGGMVLAQLVRRAVTPLSIIIIDDSPHAKRGTAYATAHNEHVLNVRASNMGAFDDDAGGFFAWLSSAQGKAAAKARDITREFAATDFAPRALYGDYLSIVHYQAGEEAAKKRIAITHSKQHVSALTHDDTGNAITLGDGSTIHAKKLVLATGNMFATPADARLDRMPWFASFKGIASPRVALVGSGLTAMDSVLSLLEQHYEGDICCISRSGHMPHAHVAPAALPQLDVQALMHGRLSKRMQLLRSMVQHAAQQTISWHYVLDALRPHTTSLWQSLSIADQQRFMQRLFTLWNVHRHRIDPALHARIRAAANVTHLRAAFVSADDAGITVARDGGAQHIDASPVFDCRGPSYRSLPAFVADAVKHGIVTPHLISGLQTMDGKYRVSSLHHAPIYAMGALLLGERFETNAVPELRVQAREIAETLLH